MNTSEISNTLFNKACKHLVGGVNSPVRAFNAVGGSPIIIDSGKGARIKDVDNNYYIDMVLSYGPMILGHCDPEIIKSIKEAINKGFCFGSTSEAEIKLSQLICKTINYDKIRFVNSGTEAVLSALRLAKAYTKKNKIIKFEGCYHGHVDALLVKGGSGLATLSLPNSKGISQNQIKDTLIAKYNDIDSVKSLFKKMPEQIAAIIVEPVAGNMGVVLPKQDFLLGLKKLCQQYNTLLIADEVMTGFRAQFGLTHQLLNDCKADLVCLGKVIGGGMPVGAFAGNNEIMNRITPLGEVYQAGTLSGNPVTMTCGLATLKKLKQLNPYSEFNTFIKTLKNHIKKSAQKYNLPLTVNSYGSMISIFFTNQPVTNFKESQHTDEKKFKKFFHLMIKKGVYLPPSNYESLFISTAHQSKELDELCDAISYSFSKI